MNTRQEIDAALGRLHGERLLDLATGGGRFVAWMQQTVPGLELAIGADASLTPTTADQTVFEQGEAVFVCADAQQLAFPAAAFNLVTVSFGLHHMADPQRVLAEAYRILRPGGQCVIFEPYRDGEQTEAQRTHILLHHWWAGIDRALGSIHDETYARDELLTMAQASGLNSWQCFDYADLDDPMWPARHKHLRKRLAHYLQLARDLPGYEDLLTQAAAYQRRLEEVGVQTATALFAIGHKPATV